MSAKRAHPSFPEIRKQFPAVMTAGSTGVKRQNFMAESILDLLNTIFLHIILNSLEFKPSIHKFSFRIMPNDLAQATEIDTNDVFVFPD